MEVTRKKICFLASMVIALGLTMFVWSESPSNSLSNLQLDAANDFLNSDFAADESSLTATGQSKLATIAKMRGEHDASAFRESNIGGENRASQADVFKDDLIRKAQYEQTYQQPTRTIFGVDQNPIRGIEPRWVDQKPIPFELLGPGEFLGPIRLPFESNYRVRLGDQLEMTYSIVNRGVQQEYQLQIGDEIEIQSANFTEIDKQRRNVLPDGFISANAIGRVRAAGRTVDEISLDLNRKYESAGNIDPTITIAVTKSNSALTELINAVQGQFNAVGSIKQVTVSPDGTIQLPNIGRVCVYGLTLDEIEREINLRYSQQLSQLNVTPALIQLAAKQVFVFGEVKQAGPVAINGPTTALSAIAAAQGPLVGANLRQVIVIRRDENWRMIATKLDLSGAALGKIPVPSDDIWIRSNDIIIVPKSPILRLSEFVDLVFTRTIYAVMPNQGFSVNFDEGSLLE